MKMRGIAIFPGKDLTPRQSSDVIRQRYEVFCEFAMVAQRDPEQIGKTFGFGQPQMACFDQWKRSMLQLDDIMKRV